ncbi:MAG: hypothetical protein HOK92_01035 [Flavobacteriales bacterium]|nr:hypothetical protein [Flavobacteriales bacterium]
MRVYLNIILLVICFQSFGQSLDTYISDSEVRVGDIFELKYVITNTDKFPISNDKGTVFPSVLLTSDTVQIKSIPSVDVVSFTDSLMPLNDSFQVTRTYQLIVWDSCALSLIGFEYKYFDSIVRFPPAYVNVSYYSAKEGIDLVDIKERFHNWKNTNTENKKGSNTNWLLLILGILLFVVLYIFIRKIKHNKLVKNKKSLQEATLEQMNKLQKEELWKKELLKEHFVRFSHLLRSYLTNRYGVSFLDKTTQQSLFLLDSLSIDEALKNKILQLLKSSDLVKFADSNIEDKYISFLFEDFTSIVIQTTPIIEET